MTLLCGENIAHEDFLDIFGFDACPFNGSFGELAHAVLNDPPFEKELTFDGMRPKLNSTEAAQGAMEASMDECLRRA